MNRALSHLVLSLFVVFAAYPVIWVIALALSPNGIADLGLWPFSGELTLDNFRLVLGKSDGVFWIQLLNSIIVALTTSVAAVLIAAPAAYAMSRFDFVGRKAGLAALLATQMFPGVAAAVPLYLILDFLGLLDSRSGLALVYATTSVPFAIFQLRAGFDAIPRDLEEAAMVDGASQFGAFWRVVLPAAKPAIAVTILFGFMTAWNEFILAATFMSREEAFTLPVVLQRYVGEYEANWGAFAAGAVMVSLPVMLLFYILQKNLVSGLNAGGVKG